MLLLGAGENAADALDLRLIIRRDSGCVVWTLYDMWAFCGAADAMVIPSRQDNYPFTGV